MLNSSEYDIALYNKHGLALYPFQKEAVDNMIRFLTLNDTHSTYNACEQGLGKTVQAISTWDRLDCKKILVVCPAIMRLTWYTEITKWQIKPRTVEVLLAAKDWTPVIGWKLKSGLNPRTLNGTVVILSYDLLRDAKILKDLRKQAWDSIVYDEAHYLKNTRAKRTKAAWKIWEYVKYRILMSGTPFTTRIVDGYSPFHKILPNTFKDFESFVKVFCYTRETPWATEYFGLKNADLLRKILRENFYIRWTKEEAIKDLPSKTYQWIRLPIKYAVVPKAEADRDKLKVEAEIVRRCLEQGTTYAIPASLAEHRRLQGEAKVPAVCEFIQEQLDAEIPTVVFAYHKNVIAAIAQHFIKIQPSVISGATLAKARALAVKRFQDGITPLFIGQYQAAGVGITLTRSCTAVLAELDWSAASVAQAVDRLHRITQTKPVTIYWFAVENSLDVNLSRVVLSRVQMFSKVLDNEDKEKE